SASAPSSRPARERVPRSNGAHLIGCFASSYEDRVCSRWGDMAVRWRIMAGMIPHRTGRARVLAGEHRMEGDDLRKAGLKVTIPRLKILEILERSATRHLSAEDIYRSLLDSHEDIGLATVYRVLTQFEAAGLVTRHHFEDGMAVFELNQGTHHDHIVCLDCGRVEEFMDS